MCASCSSGTNGTTNPALESLTLTPSGWHADAEVGQSVVLQTKVTDASGSPVSGIGLSYTASDTTVLCVKNEGGDQAVVTALRPGTVGMDPLSPGITPLRRCPASPGRQSFRAELAVRPG